MCLCQWWLNYYIYHKRDFSVWWTHTKWNSAGCFSIFKLVFFGFTAHNLRVLVYYHVFINLSHRCTRQFFQWKGFNGLTVLFVQLVSQQTYVAFTYTRGETGCNLLWMKPPNSILETHKSHGMEKLRKVGLYADYLWGEGETTVPLCAEEQLLAAQLLAPAQLC